MASDRKFTDKVSRSKILKMPAPVDKVTKLQGQMDDEWPGFSTIHSRTVDESTGNVTLEFTVTPDTQEGVDSIVKSLTIKPFAPKVDTSRSSFDELISVDGQNVRMKTTFIHPRNRATNTPDLTRPGEPTGWKR